MIGEILSTFIEDIPGVVSCQSLDLKDPFILISIIYLTKTGKGTLYFQVNNTTLTIVDRNIDLHDPNSFDRIREKLAWEMRWSRGLCQT